jgi:formylglycine-generating enzyme
MFALWPPSTYDFGPVESAPHVIVLAPGLPERIRIRSGTFTMGSSSRAMLEGLATCKKEVFGPLCTRIENAFRAEGYAHRVTVSAFDLDRYEVSVRKYSACVRAGVCRSPGFRAGDARFDQPSYPITYVAWEDSAAYCAFAGGRLPTEAEWEFAARGSSSRIYPWGNVYNARICNHGSFSSDEGDARDGFQGLAPIDALPEGQSPEHVFNLAGNVAEWVSDFYATDAEGFGYSSQDATDPKGPDSGVSHVIRGGSFEDGAPWMRAASRHFMSLTSASSVGFRCAYDVAPKVK